MDVVPDAIEPVVGYRAFRIELAATGEPRLHSVHTPHVFWPPEPGVAPAYRAVCARPEGRVPHERVAGLHRCGFYSKNTFEDAERYARHNGAEVLGRVLCYGKVIPAERGWRAEHVQIEALYLWGRANHRKLLPELAATYDLPLVAPPAQQGQPPARAPSPEDFVARHGVLPWVASFAAVTSMNADGGYWLHLYRGSVCLSIFVVCTLAIAAASLLTARRAGRSH
ncbi:MAG: hypothetical protein ACTHNU_03950 [Gaiellales bacterium]